MTNKHDVIISDCPTQDRSYGWCNGPLETESVLWVVS